MITRLLPALLLLAAAASAQEPGLGDSQAATGGARPPQMNEGFIGRDVPAFDPGSDVVAFDGKIWNISNNRLFRARFEKYLNAAPGERPTPIHTYTGYDAWMELWKYTQADPGDGWTEVGFDDSTWRVGRDFHTRIPPSQWGNVVPDSTWWGYPTTVWQRHGFWAYGTAPSQFTMSGTDDTSRIWIDGVHPDPTAIDPETEEYAPIVATLDPGGHVLAIGPVDFA